MADNLFAGLTYEQVVVKYTKTVGSVCLVRLKNYADAEDCFQNVFARLYTKSPDFTDEKYLKAWLIRVAVNECKNYIRDNTPLLPLKDVKENSVDFPQDSCDISWALLQLSQNTEMFCTCTILSGTKSKKSHKFLTKTKTP